MTKYLILIIISLSFIIYGNSLNNAFVSDDIPDILNNPEISNISRLVDLNYFSLSGVTFTLNYLIAGYNPWIYHLTNIIIHILTSIAVFFFLRIFFKYWPSFWGTLLFVVHPIHTENITWISGRGHAFFGLFVLISFICYVKATSSYRFKWGFFISAIAMYIFSLYSGPFALLYPAMIILYDVTFRKWKKHWKQWIVFLGLACFRLLFMIGTVSGRVVSISTDVGSVREVNWFFKIAYSFFSHLWLLLWPEKLTLYHDDLSISMTAIVLEVLALGFVILLLPFIFRRAKVIFFAICIFILFLAPTYSPVTITWLVAERYLYFPSIALSLVLAFLIEKFSRKRPFKIAGIVLLVSILIACSTHTIIRNFDWKTRASLWRATAKVSPNSAKAHNNMGDIHSGEGNLKEAVKSFKRAIELKPNYAHAYHNLAHTYQQMGYLEEAIKNYKEAININENLYQSYRNLGVIYLERNELALAKEYFRKVLEINPGEKSVRRVLEMIEKRK
ncbi:MAG: tetratricopeptide repeat protein [Candidatus Omnitrophota bacterium]|nr:tetratricopeptide repeat protein [Candidatus Omnitrophota bacterium]